MPKSVFSDRYQVFIACVIEARRSSRLTQTELAMRLGKPQSFISKVETGERRLDFVEFVELARAMGLDELELAGRIVADAAFESGGNGEMAGAKAG